MSVIAHYLNCGHSLDELVNLTLTERAFYQAAWELEIEMVVNIIHGEQKH